MRFNNPWLTNISTARNTVARPRRDWFAGVRAKLLHCKFSIVGTYFRKPFGNLIFCSRLSLTLRPEGCRILSPIKLDFGFIIDFFPE